MSDTVKAPPPGGPGVDTWLVLSREDGHELGSVRLFANEYPDGAERVARYWPEDAGSGPVVLWNERTGEVVY
jgi:hypothetical protein